MLSFFPHLVEDELPYSWAARYKELSGGTAVGTLAALVGPKARAIGVLFPTHLNYLVEQFPKTASVDSDNLIDQHTVLPYYTRFFEQRIVVSCRNSMKKTWESGATSTVFFLKNLREARFLKFCSVCAAEHLQILGQAAWLRSHQLPGVLVCPIHKAWLLNSHVYLERRQRLDTIKINEAHETPKYGLDYETALRVAQSTFWLLRNPGKLTSTSELNIRMKGVLREKGFGGRGETIENTRLRELLRDYICDEYLSYVGLNTYTSSPVIWVEKLYRSQGYRNLFPIQYIVALSALNVDIADFFENEYYMREKNKISRCRVLCLPTNLTAKVMSRRNEFLAALKKNPGATRNYLHLNFTNIVQYLSKNDKAWLYERMPARKQGGFPAKYYIDWEKRDKNLAVLALNKINALRISLERPQKVTVSTFNKALHFQIYASRRKQLPETMSIIDEAIASNSTLTLRRLEWAVSHLERLSIFPCRSTFIGVATNSSAPLPELTHEIDRLHNLLRDRLEQNGKPIKRVVHKRR